MLLAAMLCLYSGTALVFYFTAGYAEAVGLAGVGFFFTLTTIGEIGVRAGAGGLLDRVNKARSAAAALVILAAAYALLGRTESGILFFGLGAIIGLGWGVTMPLFNGLMFDVSEAKFRPLNTNLGLQMFQAGYFAGPFIGGFLVDHLGLRWVFYFSAALALAGSACSILIKTNDGGNET
jgi:MFS family permease